MIQKRKIIPLIILFLIISIFFTTFIVIKPVKADVGPPDDINVWFSTDWQNADTDSMVSDVNTYMDIDIAFTTGDLVANSVYPSQWDYFHTNWDAITGTGTILYRNYTHGNHEDFYWVDKCGEAPWTHWPLEWVNRSRLTPPYDPSYGNFTLWLNNTKLGPNYTYVYGNVLFIVMGCDARREYGNCPDEVHSVEPWLDWCNQTIQNNQDYNIIILNHFDIETGTQDYYHGLLEQDDFYWIMDNYNVFAWIHGHTHYAPSVTVLHGTYHINAGKAPTSSVMFEFVDGSSTVDILQRNHVPHTWTETISGYDTLTLDYAFDSYYPGSGDEIYFISIDGSTNGTTTNDTTPTFAWSKVNNAIRYQLQIATDSGFSSIVVNLSDINENNYPSEYDDTGENVVFILPDANELSSYTTFYCRVRAGYLE